jgi:Mg2+/Co2+ transporter CorB
MPVKDRVFIGISALLAVMSVLALFLRMHWIVAVSLVVIVDLYLICVFVECAMRSTEHNHWKKVWLPLPHRVWALLLLFLLIVTVVTSFAAMFLASHEVRHLLRDVQELQQEQFTDVLDNPHEALYFSMVTITTLGYGDFAPAGAVARWIIVWELATGLLTLVLAFPLVSTRATTSDLT